LVAVLGYNVLTRANRASPRELNRFAHKLRAYLLTGAPPLGPSAGR
jgi:hypothetical protein